MVDNLLVYREEQRIQRQGVRYVQRLEKEQAAINKTRKQARQVRLDKIVFLFKQEYDLLTL